MSKDMRQFESGATRNSSQGKLDFEGFLSPIVLYSFARYMHTHRFQADGEIRASDNWQKGIPMEEYMKSWFRHFMQVWAIHRGIGVTDENGKVVTMEEALNGCLFNNNGYLHEYLKEQAKPSERNPLPVEDSNRVDNGGERITKTCPVVMGE